MLAPVMSACCGIKSQVTSLPSALALVLSRTRQPASSSAYGTSADFTSLSLSLLPQTLVSRTQSLVSEAEDPLIAVARALGSALRHVDFVPSDFAAALVLAGYQEREARFLM